MRLQLSPSSFLRRHAWGLAVLFVLVTAYFIGIGWIGEKLGKDIGTAYKATPSVEDRVHKAE
jgi:hypothetical protein